MTDFFFRKVCTEYFGRRPKPFGIGTTLAYCAKQHARTLLLFVVMLMIHAEPQPVCAGLSLMETFSFGQHTTPEDRNFTHTVTISPDGQNLYVAGPAADELSVLLRDAGTGTLKYIERQKNGINGVEGLDLLHSLIVSPDGRNVYAARDFSNHIIVFNRDAKTGVLSYPDKINADQGIGPRSQALVGGIRAIAISPDGRNIYAQGSEEPSIGIFRRNNTTGVLGYSGKYGEIAGIGVYGSNQSLIVSPDNRNLYLAGRHGDVVVFSRNIPANTVMIVERQENILRETDQYYLDAITLSPDGRYLYVAGRVPGDHAAAVAVFSRDAETGGLDFVETQQNTLKDNGCLNDVSLAASPDGRFLFMGEAGSSDDGFIQENPVKVFRRDITTGKLDIVDSMIDTFSPSRESSLSVSPDGRNLYAGDWLGVFIFGWDTDEDGIMDPHDGCPSDPEKSAPGTCGCGIPDTDTDSDGILDCKDAYPLDPSEWQDSELDSDRDGVPDLVENAVNEAGDGNADGIPDSLQPNVASLYTDDGAHVVTLESGPGTRLSHCEAATAPDPEEDALAGLEFPYGLFSFTVDGVGPEPATIKLYLPTDVPVSTYYKYGRTPDIASDHWYEFLFDGETGARMETVDDTGQAEQAGAKIVTLHFVDARRGDDILRWDGRIVDLGGPALHLESDGNSDGFGGGGGCFITTLSP